MSHPEMKPLPGPEDYEDAAFAVQDKFRTKDTEKELLALVNEYTLGKARVYKERAQRLAGKYLDPVDRSIGRDEERDIPGIFSQGVMAGIAIARFAHDGKAPYQILVPIDKVDENSLSRLDDPLHVLFQAGSTIVDTSQEGLDLMGDVAQDTVESWSESVLKPEQLRDQRSYLLGCGFIAIRAYRYMERYATIPNDGGGSGRPSMADGLSPDFDWDGALAKLIDSDTGKMR